MLEVNLKTKKWGNSIATIIPEDVVREINIKPGKTIKVLIQTKKVDLKKDFGILKGLKKPTDQIMREIDEGWN